MSLQFTDDEVENDVGGMVVEMNVEMDVEMDADRVESSDCTDDA